MNIAEILKDAPKGTKLYSLIHGEVTFSEIDEDLTLPIIVEDCHGNEKTFANDGKYYNYYNDGECVLFPSVTNRDWSTFKVEPQFPTKICDCGLTLGITKLTDEYQYKRNELNALRQLLIARDAWWKVDGDWKPVWKNGPLKHGIVCSHNQITTSTLLSSSAMLAFRTEEIRDKFLETFSDLIEQCKELI